MRRIIICVSLLTSLLPALGQEEKLQQLLREREVLIQQYQYYNAQNSNFWGKKSKKDLLHIIDTLKEIINKDSDIIKQINDSNLRKQAQVTVEKDRIQDQVFADKRVMTDNYYELKAQLDNLKNLQKRKQYDFNNLQEQLTATQAANQNSDRLLAFLSSVLLAAIIYIFNLRRQLITKR